MFSCLVCAWPGLEEDPKVSLFTLEICGCCGCQYGYDVTSYDSVKEYRESWLSKGAPWFDSDLEEPDLELSKPENWNTELAKLRIKGVTS